MAEQTLTLITHNPSFSHSVYYNKDAIISNCSRDQEDRQFPVLFRFRICQIDLFREKRKKIGPKNNLFSVEYLNKNTQGNLK